MLLVAHVIAGATIGLAVQNPVLSAPLAFATHLILDAVPHWNFPVPKERSLKSFWQAFGPDMAATVLVTGLLLAAFKSQWLLVAWGVGWASLPDFLTLFSHQRPWSKKLRLYFRLHNLVQWEVAKGPGLAIQAFFVWILLLILIGIHSA